MKLKVQLVICAEDGHEEQVQEVAVVEKPYQQLEHLGFTLAEAKSILTLLGKSVTHSHWGILLPPHALSL